MRSKQKYMWASSDFEEWVKQQQKKAEEVHLKVSTATITKKLLDEVIIPEGIDLGFPEIRRRRKQ